MSLRCGCADQGDDIVFGPVHQCSVSPVLRACGCTYDVSHTYGCPNRHRVMARPYEVVLDEAERRGD